MSATDSETPDEKTCRCLVTWCPHSDQSTTAIAAREAVASAPPATPAETLRAATELLEKLTSASTPLPWGFIEGDTTELFGGPVADDSMWPTGCVAHWTEDDDGRRLTRQDADLIVALRWAAEPLAAMLRTAAAALARNEMENGPEAALPARYTDALAIARAILGGAA
jgi:hypothetical protein